MNGSVWVALASITGIVGIVVVSRTSDSTTLGFAIAAIAGLGGYHAVKSNGTTPTATTT